MSMGAVLHQTGKINGSELGGLYKSMPQTTGLCIVGAASISAFPLFSGFVSKSMVMAAAVEEGHWIVWILPPLRVGRRVPPRRYQDPLFRLLRPRFPASAPAKRRSTCGWRWGSRRLLCVVIGCYPGWLYSLLPYQIGYQPYTGSHILAQVQLLFFSALAFIWLNLAGIYPPELRSVNIDADWIYRRLLPRIARSGEGAATAVGARIREHSVRGVEHVFGLIAQEHKPRGVLARAWPTGGAALWILVLLGACLLIYYV